MGDRSILKSRSPRYVFVCVLWYSEMGKGYGLMVGGESRFAKGRGFKSRWGKACVIMCVPSVLTVGLMLVPRVCVCMYVCIGIGLGTNVRVWASFLSKYGVRSLVSCLVSNLVSNLVSDSISTCMVGVWFHGSIVKFGRSSCRSFVCLLHHILFVVVVVTVECQDPPTSKQGPPMEGHKRQ